jgi:multidrug efflux pump subunit AcrA (membrane-fusion protein)
MDLGAIRTGPTGPYVIVVGGREAGKRQVVLGPANDELVQVLSGLEPGEKVLLK